MDFEAEFGGVGGLSVVGDAGDVVDVDAGVVGSETSFHHPWRNLTSEEGPAGTKDCSRVVE